jgi:hypothetical protein
VYVPVKPIAKILYKPRAAIQELEVAKKFTLLDSFLIFLILTTVNSWFYLVNEFSWIDVRLVLVLLLIVFPINILTVYCLVFSSSYMFKKTMQPKLLLFFLVSTQIVVTVFGGSYFVVSSLVGKNPLFLMGFMSIASLLVFLTLILGVSELSGLGFFNSFLVYVFSYVVTMALLVAAVGAATGPFILLNLVYGRMI